MNPDAVRKIEFLVDGIPVGESCSAPYSIPWISDGACHEIEARAYSAWASRTLTKSHKKIVNSENSPGPLGSPSAGAGGNTTR